jgi:hypothetical protein
VRREGACGIAADNLLTRAGCPQLACAMKLQRDANQASGSPGPIVHFLVLMT